MKTRLDLHLIILPIVFFLCIPILFISQNIQDISSLRFATFVTLTVLAASTVLVLLLARHLCRNTPLQILFTNFAEFIFFLIVLTGFILPLSTSVGMVEPSEVPINFRNLIIALFLAFGLSLVSHSKYKTSLYLGISLFIALNSIVSVSTVYSKYKIDRSLFARPDNKPLTNISNKKNIFVFSLDGISGSAANEVLAENKHLSESLNGFTTFSQVASSSPATSASTAATLYGNQDFKLKRSTEAELWDSNPRNLLTNLLEANGFQVSTFGIYGTNFMNRKRTYYSAYSSSLGVPELINFTIARTITSLYVLRKRTIGWVDQKIQSLYFLMKNEERNEFQGNLESSSTPTWKKNLAVTILDANDYIQSLDTNKNQPIAHFLHFTFTHFPVEFDEDCVLRSDDELWFYANQNRTGVKSETVCAIKFFSTFINKLKELKVFDKSLVILKSDHGKPISYYDEGSFFAEKINGHSDWGFGRYEPFLAVKGWGDQVSTLGINTSPVLLDDLAKTICAESLHSELCDIYPGFNLLKNPLSIPVSAEATLFIVSSNSSNYKYDTHKSITIKRDPSIIQNLHKALNQESQGK